MNFDIKEFLTASMILFAIIDVIGNIPLILIIREKFKIICDSLCSKIDSINERLSDINVKNES